MSKIIDLAWYRKRKERRGAWPKIVAALRKINDKG